MRYRGQNNFTYTTLQNEANRSHEKQNAGSARRVTRIAGSPFCDGMLTFLARPIFLHIQLFRERLSEKVRATIPKGIVGGFECTVLQRNLKEWHGMFAMLCLRLLKKKQPK